MDMIADRAMIRINPLIAQVTDRIDDIEIPPIPEVSLQPVLDAISMQSQTLKAEVVDSCTQAFNGMQSGIVRANGAALKGIDELIENAGEDIMAEALASGGQINMLKTQILAQQVPKGYAKQNPVGNMIWNAGKVAIVNAIDAGQIPGLAGEVINKGQPVTKVTGPLG
jgi:hypothetical protein